MFFNNVFIEINDIENGFLWIFKEPKRLRMASYNLWVQNQEILVSIGFEILEFEKFNWAQMHKQLRAVVELVARYSNVTLDKYSALEFINRTLSRTSSEWIRRLLWLPDPDDIAFTRSLNACILHSTYICQFVLYLKTIHWNRYLE